MLVKVNAFRVKPVNIIWHLSSNIVTSDNFYDEHANSVRKCVIAA